MKYPALVYVGLYGGAVLALLLAPITASLLFIIPAVMIAEFAVSPEILRTAKEDGIHRAD